MNKELAPRELRIGNKLQKSNGEVFTIKRLDKTEDVLVEEENSLLTLNYNLHGIPLTEEILLKCGFEECYNDHPFPNHKGFDKGIFHVKIYNSTGIKKIWYGPTIIENNYFFIHQLQNLFFALTGEELEIKL